MTIIFVDKNENMFHRQLLVGRVTNHTSIKHIVKVVKIKPPFATIVQDILIVLIIIGFILTTLVVRATGCITLQ
jgi:hypothetical protein